MKIKVVCVRSAKVSNVLDSFVFVCRFLVLLVLCTFIHQTHKYFGIFIRKRKQCGLFLLYQMDRWSGRTAVVTGAGGGIGSAVSLSLANQGLNVVGVDKQTTKIDELANKVTGSGSITSRKCDLSKPAEVAELFASIDTSFGGTDILVNNAGVVYHGSITDIGPSPVTVDELLQHIDVNVKSVVLCSRNAASSMHRKGVPGHIININSIIGHSISSQPIFNTYCASKHAITALTKTLQVEFSTFKANIKISSLSPSLVNTAMAEMKKMPELRATVSQAPMLQPQDIVDAIVYLLSTPPHVSVEELTIAPVGDMRI